MNRSKQQVCRFAGFALSTVLSATLFAQTTSTAPVNSTAATTATSPGSDVMSKSDLKNQRKQQKRDEAASNDNVKAAKAAAKAKKANDKALQSQEKAGQVNPTTTTTTPQ